LDAKTPAVPYKVVELDQDVDGKAIRAVMGERLGRTSVPAIWIAGEFVGGCNDGPMGGLVSLEESGILDSLLQKALAS
jgi:glutaredoxin-related protein